MVGESISNATLGMGVRSLEWGDGELLILDQTQLPQVVFIETLTDLPGVISAIKALKVRGAPAIGVASAYGMILGLPRFETVSALKAELNRRGEELIGARPTAVNLSWAVKRMQDCLDRNEQLASPEEVSQLLLEEAQAIHQEDVELCQKIGRNGTALVKEHPRILTHCNAGALAVSELGTALAPIYLAHEQGIGVHVYVDETRPLLQGARLTAFELQKNGVPMTLTTDSMAATVMQAGNIDMVLVGADRIAANGDVANKIGTLSLAVLSQYFKIPFYVAAPYSTIDLATKTGKHILVEERDSLEVTHFRGQEIAPAGTDVFNPAFDITPASLVTGLITDRGLLLPRELSKVNWT